MQTEKDFDCKRILVIGDIMLDRYCFGKVERISPEAPVPVLRESKARAVPGGASNVAVNLVTAGQNVSILSVLGRDSEGRLLKQLLEEHDIDVSMIILSDVITTTKNRFIGQNNQQIFRYDKEEIGDISDLIVMQLLDSFQQHASEFDMVVLSDYGKGVCSKTFLQELFSIAVANQIRIIVDVKGKDASKYKGAYLIKPNLSELEELTSGKIHTREELKGAALSLCNMCGCEYVLVTCGEQGMRLVDKHGGYLRVMGAAKEVYDVTGAGDTALAYLTAALANGIDIEEAVVIANCASGIQVSKVGTSPVYLEEVRQSRDGMEDAKASAKIIPYERAGKIKELLGEKSIVFTNGCFDILHAGHVDYLRKAASFGDVLVVGVNSDTSIKRLKGESRPVNPVEARMKLLAALEFVDYVVEFEQDTPAELISLIEPHVLVKGADYKPEEVVGKDFVERYGGRLELVPLTDGYSTTGILKKMNDGENSI